jgi:hypothetical protein
MALQSSGAISIDDIRTELGTTTGSLAQLSAAVGFPAPHAMSDFYGYTATTPNDLYWDFAEDDGGAKFVGDAGDSPGPFSFSMFVRPSWTAVDFNVMLFEINTGSGLNSDRLLLIYDYGLNRLVFRYRGGTSNHHINWALNANSASGNISRWHSTSTGPVNANGFAHIAGTFDPTQSLAINGLKLYWNGVAFNTAITQANGTMSPFPKTNMYINVAFNETADRSGDFDNVAFWFNRLLTPSEIVSLYNDGKGSTAADAGLTTGLGFEATMESGAFIDNTGNWTPTAVAGQAIPY